MTANSTIQVSARRKSRPCRARVAQNKRSMTATMAALGAVEMNIAEGRGAPW